MKNRELKKMFYLWCSPITYTPSIFEDEIWDYFMNGVGKYVGADKVWEHFYYIANNVYNGDLTKMNEDFFKITDELTTLINTNLGIKFSEEKYPSTEPYDRFINIPNGRYLYLDMRDAMFQSLFYYDIVTKDEYNTIFSKYENGEELKKCKWITYYVFLRSILPHKNQYKHSFVKQLINDTINSDDPLFTTFKNKINRCHISGDRLYIPLYQKDIETYNDILNKDYTATNGAVFFVDICEKRVIRHGDITVVVNESLNSSNTFYQENNSNLLNYDLYPQAYKKISKQSIEKYDLAYGYDDDINFFEKKIWE